MADITMCVNTECPNAKHCYRILAEASERQSFAAFKYIIKNKAVECKNYLPIVNDTKSK